MARKPRPRSSYIWPTWMASSSTPARSTKSDGEELKKLIKGEDWNDLHLIARGNTIIQLLNGRITSMLIDDDTAGRKLSGLIGIQVHKGPPMKIEARHRSQERRVGNKGRSPWPPHH